MSFEYKNRQLKALVKKYARILDEEKLHFQVGQSKSTRERIEARQEELKEKFSEEIRAIGGYRKAVYILTSKMAQCLVIGRTPTGRLQLISLYDIATCMFRVIMAAEPVYDLPDDADVAKHYMDLINEEQVAKDRRNALEKRWRIE